MAQLLIINAKLLDCGAGELRDGASLLAIDDKIVEIEEGGRTLRAPGDAVVIDANGRTLMPGLIDAHVHAAITTVDLAAMLRKQSSWIGIEAKFILEGMLKRGFTTVRDAGGLDTGNANALERGQIRGPRVFRSGRVLSQTGGHGDFDPVDHSPGICACCIKTSYFAHIADGVDAVRRAAREELKAGAHQIKVMAGGGVASPSDPVDMVQYTEPEIRAAVEEAEARRTYAFAHAYIPEAITRAVRAGVRSIEHGNLIDEATAKVMAERGCFLVPTLVVYDQIAQFGRSLRFPEASMKKLGDVSDAGLRSLEIARAAGVKMGYGTDLLGELHPAQSKEFEIRSQALPPVEIIRSATTINAELLGKVGLLGDLRVGAFADFLLVNGDPLKEIDVLSAQGERLDLIVRGGEIITNRIS